MNSIAFPKIFDTGKTLIVTGHEAAAQNLKLLLTSNCRELFCDPLYGDNLKSFFYDKNNIFLKEVIIDDLYCCIKEFAPEITCRREDIDIIIDKRDMYCIINCVNTGKTVEALKFKLLEIENTQY